MGIVHTLFWFAVVWYRASLSISWWRHQMETFSALLAICAGNSPVTGEFPTQRPVTRSFDVYFDLCPNERLSKQSWGWWFETLSSPLWRHRNVLQGYFTGTAANIQFPTHTLKQSHGDGYCILTVSQCKRLVIHVLFRNQWLIKSPG